MLFGANVEMFEVTDIKKYKGAMGIVALIIYTTVTSNKYKKK